MPLLIALIVLLSPAPAEAQQGCFGAQALQPHCVGAAEPKTVSPSIGYASRKDWGLGILRNANYCRGRQRLDGAVRVCRLTKGSPTVALIGDSHSAAFRPAFAGAAKRRGWSAISLVQPGCEYNLLDRIRYGFADQSACRAWRADIPRFLAQYPKLKTVFMTQFSYQEPRADEIASYQAAWRKLPSSVENLWVIRDNPRSAPDNYKCISRALRQGLAPGSSCAQARSQALTSDWAAEAAVGFPERNGRVVDLSSSFCSSEFCYPVVGGALVYAEGNHQTPVFNRTLVGPFLAAYAAAGGR